jgi:hypothetical protein
MAANSVAGLASPCPLAFLRLLCTRHLQQPVCSSLLPLPVAPHPSSDLTRTDWFSLASLEADVEYALVGALLGLAIYNSGEARFIDVAQDLQLRRHNCAEQQTTP